MAMVQLVTDNFTRANENPLSNGGKWSQPGYATHPLQVLNNVCDATTLSSNNEAVWTGSIVQTGDSWPADQYSEATINYTIAEIFDIYVRTTSSSTNTKAVLEIISGASTQNLYIVVNGSLIQTYSFSATPSTGDVWRLAVSGSTYTVLQNSVTKLTQADSSISSGIPGLGLQTITAIADANFSLWAGGANQAATPTFNPVAGSYATAQNVQISSSTPGGLIYYTTNGTTPTHSSSSIANGGTVTVSTPLTIKAFASVTNFADSATGSAAYTGSLTPGNNSSWLSINNNNALRGSRSH